MFITEHDDGSVSYTGSFYRIQWDEYLDGRGLAPSVEGDGVPTGLDSDGNPVLPADQPGTAGADTDSDVPPLSEQLAALAESNAADADTDESVEESGQPAGNASADDWRAYAVSQGADEDEVADLTRNELRDQYGTE